MKPPRVLALVGMSGVGKSHLAEQLHEQGWHWLDCDARIATELSEDCLQIKEGEKLVHAVGRWMGMPWDSGYQIREKQYLEIEARITTRALEEARVLEGNCVLDTTGSVVHLNALVTAPLRQHAHVCYLTAPTKWRKKMVQSYKLEPKPLIWAEHFACDDSQPTRLLASSYESLLSWRETHYARLAHQQIGAELFWEENADIASLFGWQK